MSEAIPVKDDKRIVTDIAFGVSESLLGKKLATPIQRGTAMLVDAFLVLMLTNVSGAFWGLFAGLAFFRAGRKREKKNMEANSIFCSQFRRAGNLYLSPYISRKFISNFRSGSLKK
jgi:hypothetical protein